MLAGTRRALQIFAGVAVPTALVSLLLGLAFGAPALRALAAGFYLVGSLIMVVGVLSGMRGPVRSTLSESDPGSLFGMGGSPRRLRKATEEERRDAFATAVLFLILGLVLVSLGAAADTEVDLL